MSGPPVINWLINIYKPHEYYSHLRIINHRHCVIYKHQLNADELGPHIIPPVRRYGDFVNERELHGGCMDAKDDAKSTGPVGPSPRDENEGTTENGLDVGEMPISTWGLSWKVHGDICMCIYIYIHIYIDT